MADKQPGLFKRILRDPLTHFLGAGLLLFVAYGALNTAQDLRDDRTIVVTDEKLTVWLQFRKKAFSPAAAKRTLDNLSADEKARMVEDYAREEALYRHAKALGLDANDAIIRQRLIQKMDYALTGLNGDSAPTQVAEATLRAFYDEDPTKYKEPGHVTFTHIFFAGKEGETKARAAWQQIQAGNPPPNGDRFLYRRDYGEATYALVNDHMGMKIADTVFGEITPKGEWLPPTFSNHGWHILKVINLTPTRLRPFEEAVGDVLQDWQRARETEARRKAMDGLLKNYTVVVP